MPNLLLRNNVARGIALNAKGEPDIDTDKGIIYGYAVISKGEALGHGIEIDDTTLDQVTKLGNALRVGVKSRFGHPTMSGEALGTFLGRAKNFRLDKKAGAVRADLHLDETAFGTPNGNLAQYVLDLANSDPSSFGTSIVARIEREERLEKDGTRKKDKDGNDLQPLARVQELRASDVVDDPAANANGFFSADVELSAQATVMLDKLLQHPEAAEKIANFFENYFAYKIDTGKFTGTNSKKEIDTMPEENTEKLTQEQLDTAVTEAVGKERARCAAIFSSASGFAKSGTDVQQLAVQAIKEGTGAAETEGQFKDARIKQLEAEKQAPPEAAHTDDADGSDLKHGEYAKHKERAEAYAVENKCSMTAALKATAPKGHATH